MVTLSYGMCRYSILLEEKPPSAAEAPSTSLQPKSEQQQSSDAPSSSGKEATPSESNWWKRWSNVVVGGQLGTSAQWARQLARDSLGSTTETSRLINRAKEKLRRQFVVLWNMIKEHRDKLLFLLAVAW